MARKTRIKSRGGADIEAQTNDEGVPRYNLSLSHIFSSFFLTKGIRQQAAHEMRVFKSRSEGEPSGGTASGSNVKTREVDHETQAGASTRSQALSPKDSPLSSGEYFTICYCPSEFGDLPVTNTQSKMFNPVMIEILATSLNPWQNLLPPKCLA